MSKILLFVGLISLVATDLVGSVRGSRRKEALR